MTEEKRTAMLTVIEGLNQPELIELSRDLLLLVIKATFEDFGEAQAKVELVEPECQRLVDRLVDMDTQAGAGLLVSLLWLTNLLGVTMRSMAALHAARGRAN
jgi:hypothetical protein